MEAGKQFGAIKQDLGNRHWAPWLQQHEIPRGTADRLARIAERFAPLLPTVGRIDDDDLVFDIRALEALASPDVPVAAAEKAISRAADGEHITKAEAEAMIEAARSGAALKSLKTAARLDLRASSRARYRAPDKSPGALLTPRPALAGLSLAKPSQPPGHSGRCRLRHWHGSALPMRQEPGQPLAQLPALGLGSIEARLYGVHPGAQVT